MIQGIEIQKDEKDEICREIIEALCDGFGTTLTLAIQKVNKNAPRVSQSEVYTWKKEDPEFSKAIDAARAFGMEKALDLAESRVIRIVQNTNLKAHDKILRYFLDRKGKSRGYGAPDDENLTKKEPPALNREAYTIEQIQRAMANLRDQI